MTAAKGDAAHYKQCFEEVQCKFERLEGQARAKGGSAGCLRRRRRGCGRRGTFEEKDTVRSEAERTGFEREVTWLEEQRQPCEEVMVALQCPCGVL